MDYVQFTGGQLVGHHTLTNSIPKNKIHHLIFIQEMDIILEALLIERLQNHVTGAIRRITGSLNGPFAEIPSVAAERTLIELSVRGAIEGEPHVFEVVHGFDCLASHDLHG